MTSARKINGLSSVKMANAFLGTKSATVFQTVRIAVMREKSARLMSVRMPVKVQNKTVEWNPLEPGVSVQRIRRWLMISVSQSIVVILLKHVHSCVSAMSVNVILVTRRIQARKTFAIPWHTMIIGFSSPLSQVCIDTTAFGIPRIN